MYVESPASADPEGLYHYDTKRFTSEEATTTIRRDILDPEYQFVEPIQVLDEEDQTQINLEFDDENYE